MGYVDEQLATGERVLYRGKVHWAIGLRLAILGLVLTLLSEPAVLALGVILIGLSIVRVVVSRLTNEYAVTSRRVIVKAGFISRNALELNLGKLESVSVSQGITGRILGYGKLIIRGTGGPAGGS